MPSDDVGVSRIGDSVFSNGGGLESFFQHLVEYCL